GERREVPVRVKIPRSAAGRRVAIVVFAGAAPSSSDDMLEALFEEEERAAPRSLPLLRALYTDEGVSGLRAIALPGRSASAAEAFVSGSDEEGEVSEDQLAALMRSVQLVQELPTLSASGTASGTLRARR